MAIEIGSTKPSAATNRSELAVPGRTSKMPGWPLPVLMALKKIREASATGTESIGYVKLAASCASTDLVVRSVSGGMEPVLPLVLVLLAPVLPEELLVPEDEDADELVPVVPEELVDPVDEDAELLVPLDPLELCDPVLLEPLEVEVDPVLPLLETVLDEVLVVEVEVPVVELDVLVPLDEPLHPTSIIPARAADIAALREMGRGRNGPFVTMNPPDLKPPNFPTPRTRSRRRSVVFADGQNVVDFGPREPERQHLSLQPDLSTFLPNAPPGAFSKATEVPALVRHQTDGGFSGRSVSGSARGSMLR
jgi:hypothetical protein